MSVLAAMVVAPRREVGVVATLGVTTGAAEACAPTAGLVVVLGSAELGPVATSSDCAAAGVAGAAELESPLAPRRRALPLRRWLFRRLLEPSPGLRRRRRRPHSCETLLSLLLAAARCAAPGSIPQGLPILFGPAVDALK